MYASSRRPLGRRHQRDRLLQGQRLGRPPGPLPLGRLDQRRDVPRHQVVTLGVPDGPDQHVVRDLHRPRRRPRGHRGQRALDSAAVSSRQPDSAELLVQRLHDRAPVQGHGPRRQPVHAMGQPVLQRVAARCSAAAAAARRRLPCAVPGACRGPRPWCGRVTFLPDTRPGRARTRGLTDADVPVLGGVPVDRVLAVPATLARGFRHDRAIRHWLPVWLPRHPFEGRHSPLTWCARQDSNPRPAA